MLSSIALRLASFMRITVFLGTNMLSSIALRLASFMRITAFLDPNMLSFVLRLGFCFDKLSLCCVISRVQPALSRYMIYNTMLCYANTARWTHWFACPKSSLTYILTAFDSNSNDRISAAVPIAERHRFKARIRGAKRWINLRLSWEWRIPRVGKPFPRRVPDYSAPKTSGSHDRGRTIDRR
ncbi:hypothetical protein BDW22DRAFT_574206 [Trametopsis cervina]|nr:hypothetical protein BDW22DRAFT_574206 [Trametopsis cervina]